MSLLIGGFIIAVLLPELIRIASIVLLICAWIFERLGRAVAALLKALAALAAFIGTRRSP
jgi:hypothetical protein